MVGIAYLFSSSRKDIKWRLVGWGISLQIVFGALILKTEAGRAFFEYADKAFRVLLGFTTAGAEFLFGGLVDPSKIGWSFATMVLPTIIFVGTLMGILYHIGIMQFIVGIVAKVMMKTMKTSGSESLAAAANIFIGQTEAPLVIGPYLKSMTRSEILALMIGGMATIAGGVLAAYVGIGIDAGHLIAASVMSAPAALVISKILIPETEESVTEGNIKIELPKVSNNIIEAAANGATDGLKLAVNVGGMLLAFVALIAMVNGGVGWIGGFFGYPELSFQIILGYLFAPIAFVLGVPWSESMQVGSLFGVKTVLNEFVAYTELQKQLTTLSPRSIAISTYALCGFSNFASIAIQIGGIGALVPEKKSQISQLGLTALLGGTLACFMTAAIAGMML